MLRYVSMRYEFCNHLEESVWRVSAGASQERRDGDLRQTLPCGIVQGWLEIGKMASRYALKDLERFIMKHLGRREPARPEVLHIPLVGWPKDVSIPCFLPGLQELRTVLIDMAAQINGSGILILKAVAHAHAVENQACGLARPAAVQFRALGGRLCVSQKESKSPSKRPDARYARYAALGCESRMAVMSAAWFVEFRQRLPMAAARGLMLSLAGVSVALIRAFHARLEAAGFDQGAEGQNSLSADDPPAHAGALHALCHQGLVGSLDHA